ncbi:hypothetical protein C8F04DRAFT_1184881 [Mycena alexandri]|uniref:Uncharacterized protein n=1 Tax=Mycena alexandri TaxID=1745969 RepID=A0AAD6SRI4_9AGAR|nr:hypothetical protein C8F04DRAFT_1184881 [Mycena alexandri]
METTITTTVGLTLEDIIRLHQPPVVRYAATSRTTKSVSKAELGLGRRLLEVRAEHKWVDDIKKRYGFASITIPHDYKDPKLVASLLVNQDPDPFIETQELVTHMFHRDHTLGPAVRIAVAYVTLGGRCGQTTAFSQAAIDAIRTLTVRPGEHEDSLIYPDHQLSLDVLLGQRWQENPPQSGKREAHLILGEDKTHTVMKKARPEIDDIVAGGTYQYPTIFEKTDSGIRILTQWFEGLESDGVIQEERESCSSLEKARDLGIFILFARDL